MDLPFCDGDETNCWMEKDALGPFPPAPAQVVQLCHPDICSMREKDAEPEGAEEGVLPEPPTLMVNLFV